MNKIFALFFCLMFCALYLVGAQVFINFMYPVHFQEYVNKAVVDFGVDDELIFAVIKSESNFNDSAVSSSGALGLMQLLPTTAEYVASLIDYEEDINLFDAEINIYLGTAYINYLMNKFNNLEVVLCAYNAGEGVVLDWIDDNGEIIRIEYAETQNYVNKVFYAKKIYNLLLK